MAGVAVGYECPQCGYDGGNPHSPTLILEMHDFDNVPIGMDLECGACHYQWREIFPERE